MKELSFNINSRVTDSSVWSEGYSVDLDYLTKDFDIF